MAVRFGCVTVGDAISLPAAWSVLSCATVIHDEPMLLVMMLNLAGMPVGERIGQPVVH